MTLPAFRVLQPQTLSEAIGMLDAHGGEAMVIAGGTDVIPNLQMKLFAPRVLVDIKPLGALAKVEFSRREGLQIGALATLAQVLETPWLAGEFPVLASAMGTIAGPLQRNMGTVGGNLCLETRCRWYNQSHFWRQSLGGCLKKDGTVCHVAPGGKFCWAAWSGDSAPAFLALDAEVEIAGPRGSRRIPLGSLYKKDGKDRIALAPNELLTAVHVPAGMAGRPGVYHKLRVRDSIDYPLAGVAVAMEVDARGICRDGRVALCGVNPAPVLVSRAKDLLMGQKWSPALAETVAHLAIQTGKPLTTSASTPVYRREMLRLFTEQALAETWKKGGRRP